MRTQLLAAAIASVFAHASFAADSTPTTDQEKLSYSLGMMIGERLKSYDDISYELFMQGLQAQHQGNETLLTIDDAQQVLQDQQQEAQKKQAVADEAKAAEAKVAGDTYLNNNAARENVSVTDTGLQYEVLTASDGAKPSLDDTVTVHYVGTLLDGTEFDSSITRGEPASFPLKGVIPGWTEGLQLMNVGSKFRFVIPSDLAYGERGAGQNIGPGETLIFEVELLEIQQ